MDRLTQAIAQLTATVDPLNAKFDGLEQSITKSGVAAQTAREHIENIGSSAHGAGNEIQRVTSEFGPLGGALADASEHARLFSMGLNAMGLEADASLEKMLGLGQFLNGLGSALPQIVAVGAGLAALAGGFEFMKTSVEKASELQRAMMILGQNVRNQGGDWDTLSAKVKAYAETQEHTTVFSNLEVIESLNRLVATGTSLSDAMTIIRVAEDAAAATGKSLMDVTFGLMEAEHGRTRVLSDLGIGTRQSIHDGMTLDQVLATIEDHMGGAAQTAANTYSGSLKQLADSWEHLFQDVGTPFLGVLTDLAKKMDDAVESADKMMGGMKSLAPEVENVVSDIDKLAQEIAPTLNDALVDLDNILGGDAVNAWGAFRDAISSTLGTVSAAVSGIREAIQAVGDFENAGKDAGNWANSQVARIPFIGSWLANANEAISNQIDAGGSGTLPTPTGFIGPPTPPGMGAHAPTHTAVNPMVGGPVSKKKSAGSPFNFSPEMITATDATPVFKDETDAVKELAEALKLLPKNVDGYNQALAELRPLIAADQTEENNMAMAMYRNQQTYGESVNAYNAGISTLRQAQQAYNEYGKSLDGTTKLSKDQKETLDALKNSVSAAKQNVDNLKESMNSSKAAYESAAASLKKISTELEGYERLAQAAQAAIDKLVNEWSSYVEKAGQKYEEDYLTFGMTNAQKVAFYRNIVDSIKVIDDNSLHEKEDAYAKELQAEVALEQQALASKINLNKEYAQDFKQFIDQESSLVSTLMSDIVMKHKNLRDELKNVENQMVQDWIKMIDQMVAQWIDSKLLGFIASIFGGGSGGGGIWLPQNLPGSPGGPPLSGPSAGQGGGSFGSSATQSAVAGASSYGILGALLGSEGASQVVAALSTSSAATHPFVGATAGPSGSGNLTINVPNAAGVTNAMGGPSASATGGRGGTASALGGPSGAGAGSKSLASLFTGAGTSSLGSAIASAFGGSGGGGSAYGSTADTVAAYGGGGASGGAASVVPAGASMLPASGMRNLVASALGGEIIGNMLGKAFYGNATNASDSVLGSELGGAAGGVLASILIGGMWGSIGGPIGIALGAVIGALTGGAIGSLFGDHFPKANEPDVYDTKIYGQELADLQGSTGGDPMIANGQKFTMDSWTSSQTNGQGWNILMESFVQRFRNNQKALPSELQGGFAQIEQLWGGAQNTNDFNANGKNGMLQLGSGETAEWSTFWSYISAYGPAVAQLMALYQPTDLYSASLNGSVAGMGGYTPGGDPWMLHSFPDAGTPDGAGSMAPQIISPPGGSRQTAVNINVYQQFAGSLIADSAVDRRILQALEKIPGFSAADIGAAQ